MDCTITPEQQMLKDAVGRFAREASSFEQWRKLVATQAPFDTTNWRRMAEMGWLGLGMAEEDGGIGATPAETMLVMEGIGQGLMREPYVSTCVLAMHLVSKGLAADNPLRSTLLEGIADGSVLIATALGEPQSRFDLGNVNMTASKAGDGFVLDGIKSWVPDATTANWIIVPARTSSGAAGGKNGITLFIVPADAPGLQRSDFRSPDHQAISQLTLKGVQASTACIIGSPGEGLALLEYAVDHAITARLAEACGVMDALCAVTLDYLKMRKQFGVTIGSFQALQHRMVDMNIAAEEARSMLDFALAHLNAPDAERRRAVSGAKARIGQCGLYVGHQAVQLHGGIGASDELVVSHYLKRLAMIDISYGNSDFHRDQFAKTSDLMAGATQGQA